MTRDEFMDIIARMTPDQRKVCSVLMAVVDYADGFPSNYSKYLDHLLIIADGCCDLNHIYEGAVDDR